MLYICEIWSVALREERKQILFEKRIMRRILGPKKDENVECRRLHIGEVDSLYRSPNIVIMIESRRLRKAVHVARVEQDMIAFKL